VEIVRETRGFRVGGSSVVGPCDQAILESQSFEFEICFADAFPDFAWFVESDIDVAERFWNNEAVPAFQSPGGAVSDVDGDDFGGGGLCDFDETGLDDVAGTFGAVGGQADVESFAKGLFHADQCRDRAAGGRAADGTDAERFHRGGECGAVFAGAGEDDGGAVEATGFPPDGRHREDAVMPECEDHGLGCQGRCPDAKLPVDAIAEREAPELHRRGGEIAEDEGGAGRFDFRVFGFCHLREPSGCSGGDEVLPMWHQIANQGFDLECVAVALRLISRLYYGMSCRRYPMMRFRAGCRF